MFTTKHKQLSFKQLRTTRQILPTLEPTTFTAQTIIINSPNCNIKYIKRENNTKFSTIDKESMKQSRSLLQMPIERSMSRLKSHREFQQRKGRNRNGSQLSKKRERERELEDAKNVKGKDAQGQNINTYFRNDTISFPHRLKTIETDKLICKTRSQPKTLPSNVKKETTPTPHKLKLKSCKQHLLSNRSFSPYLISNTQKVEKTITSRRPKRNIINFRRQKCFMSAGNIKNEVEEQIQKQNQKKLEDVVFEEDKSMVMMNQNIEKAWRKYERNQYATRVKSNYDIQSYISSVAVPVIQNKTTSPEPNFKKEKKQKVSKLDNSKYLQYNFQFQEQEEEVSLDIQHSITHRKKDRVISSKKHQSIDQ